ncbi:unnamed protein product, partial [Nesidiocoris tenuis]
MDVRPCHRIRRLPFTCSAVGARNRSREGTRVSDREILSVSEANDVLQMMDGFLDKSARPERPHPGEDGGESELKLCYMGAG